MIIPKDHSAQFIAVLADDSPVILRAVDQSDINDLHRFCWSDRPVSAVVEFITRCQSFVAQKRGFALVVEKNRHVIGYGMVTKWFRIGEISDLIVTPTLRGQGIGTAIIERLTLEAEKLGIQELEIGVANSNPRAYKLYKQLGFVPVREIELDFGRGLEPVTYLMKHLPAEDTVSSR